jgi:hypothetical protein
MASHSSAIKEKLEQDAANHHAPDPEAIEISHKIADMNREAILQKKVDKIHVRLSRLVQTRSLC